MKLVIKTIIDIPACIFLIQISDLIVFGIFQATGLASNLLVAVIALMMLYCINLTLDEVKFLKMSKAKTRAIRAAFSSLSSTFLRWPAPTR